MEKKQRIPLGKAAKQDLPPRPPPLVGDNVRGGLPYPAGKPILTPAERAAWARLGLNEGEIPPTISKEDAELVQQMMNPATPADKLKDTKPPIVTAMENLPVERQEEYRKLIESNRASKALEAADKRIFQGAQPEFAAARDMALAADPSRASVNDPADIPVYDDRAVAAKTPTPPLTVAPVSATTPSLETVSTGANIMQTHCPHCGWDLAKNDEIVVEVNDKRSYLVAAATGERFYKSYSLFGGALRVTFRDLTAKEGELILTQLYIDAKEGRLNAQPEFYKKTREYRLALSLAALTSNTSALSLPTFEEGYEFPAADDTTTNLPELVAYLDEHVIKKETLRRVLMRTQESFDVLVHKIEAGADDPDFTKAIEDAAS